MSYTPTTWSSGDTITAAALNKMEQGITNSGPLIVHINYDQNGNRTLDKTWLEIYNAAISVGVNIYARLENGDDYDISVGFLQNIYFQNNEYYIDINGVSFVTDTQNGYPAGEDIK